VNVALAEPVGTGFDAEAIRDQFPILRTQMQGKPLVYLDSAASTQKPAAVLEAHKSFYETDYANIHRGIYDLSQRATAAHDAARRKIQRFINAADWREVVFTRNATEAINIVANCFTMPRLSAGDEILVTELEHHANIVPWQMIGQKTGAKVVAAPVLDDGELDLERFFGLIGPRTRMVAVAWISNVLGTILPVERIIAAARKRGIPVLIDAAQAVQHRVVDVRSLDADFIVFSGHKMYGPSGTGVLWGKAEHLENMEPYQGGGDMIDVVSFAGTTWNEIPFKFEAGTPDIAGIVALGAAVDWLTEIGLDQIEAHETALLDYAMRAMQQVPGLSLLGTARQKSSVLAFKLDGAHPQDIGTMLDLDGIAIRTGHHCAMPLHARFGVSGSARASLGAYNTTEDIDALVRSLNRIAGMFQ